MMLRRTWRLSPDGDPSGNGERGDGGRESGGDREESRRYGPFTTDAREHKMLRRTIDRYGGVWNALVHLARDGKRYRDRLRNEPNASVEAKELVQDMEAELEDVRKQLPGERDVVLRGEEAEQYRQMQQTLRELGIKPTDIKPVVEERNTLKTAEQQRKDNEKFDIAAKALGYNGEALRKVARAEDLDITVSYIAVKDGDEERQEPRIAVRRRGEKDAAPEAFSTFAERELKVFLPSLRLTESEEGARNGGRSEGDGGTPRRGSEHAWPNQSGSRRGQPAKKAGAQVVTEYATQRYPMPGQEHASGNRDRDK